MSLLPQQKKSAKEIATLREALGILGRVPGEDGWFAEESAEIEHESSLEPDGILSNSSAVESAPQESPPIEEPDAPSLIDSPKPVRSLRKSERLPIPPISRPSPISPLPVQRHSDEELNGIRRRESLALLAGPVHPALRAAHNALIIPGYLFALAGAVCYSCYDLEIEITSGCVLASLLVAAFIFIKKPLSRHHAGFISVEALLVSIFGTLHYFPNLKYGT